MLTNCSGRFVSFLPSMFICLEFLMFAAVFIVLIVLSMSDFNFICQHFCSVNIFIALALGSL